MIRIVNDRGQIFGEIWRWKLRWESIEGYLERKGVPVDDLQANLTYDEDRLGNYPLAVGTPHGYDYHNTGGRQP